MFPDLSTEVKLILAIAGTVISFLIFLTEKVVRKQKMRLFLILVPLGFLILTGQQVIGYLEEKNSALVNETKTEIIGEIRKKVTRTLTLVEQLSEKLKGESPSKIGVELIQYTKMTKPNELAQFFKGSPEKWKAYADWLNPFKLEEKRVPCLSLMLNANKHYNINLLLAYLFTNSETKKDIEGIISSHKWLDFPDSDFVKEFGFPEPDVKYVLFYDGGSKKLIGYANARLFAEEVLLYKMSKKKRSIEEILNKKDPDYMVKMKKNFKTFNTNISKGNDAFMTAKEMLERKINEMAVVYKGQIYLVNLSSIVKIVS